MGQQGVILDVDYTKERVFIEGLSVVNKKHVKPQSDKANPDGGILENAVSYQKVKKSLPRDNH